jgi:hypothetical protein
LLRQLRSLNAKLARFQNVLPRTAPSRFHANVRTISTSWRSTVRIGIAQPLPVRSPRLQMFQQRVYFRNRPQPAEIFEHLITHLFSNFLRGKPAPQKVGLAFRLSNSNSYFYCPLRSPLVNTCAVMAREVEMRAQSQQGVHGIQGETVTFKLCAQFPTLSAPRIRMGSRLAGACRQSLQQPTRRNEIDISDPTNRLCLAYNVCAGIRRVEDPHTDLNTWAAQTNLHTTACNLLSNAGCKLDKRFYKKSDIDKIQNYLNRKFPETFRLVVVQLNKIQYKGPPARHLIVLRFAQNHFTLLRNLAVYMKVVFVFRAG